MIIAFMAIVAMADARADELILATGEWTPYTSEKLENYGFFTEIVAEVCKEMGVVPTYKFYPWRRCFSMVEKGEVMGAFPYTYTDERAMKVYFTETVTESNTVFFQYGNKKPIKFKSLKDLKKIQLGGVVGYFYEEAFRQVGLKVDYAPDEKSAIAKLIAGRMDLLALNELVGWHLIKKDFPAYKDQFKTLDNNFSRNELKLIVAKDYPDSKKFLKNFNKALKKVLAGEMYKNILEKYGLGEKNK